MNDPLIGANRHIHIVGIGGAGMSAIARVLLQRGVTVSGSDRQANEITAALHHDGATIYPGHRAEQIAGATALFVTSAAKDDNPEIAAARAAGIPVLTRREFFKTLLPDKDQIAVAGTHGKTTTTAMIIHMLREVGADPSYIVGGTLRNTGDNAHAGQGSAFVVEADEYGGMFLGLSPHIAVITNIEHDHPDMFPTMADVVQTFEAFTALLPSNGSLIACADDPQALALAQRRADHQQTVITYGLENPQAAWRAMIHDTKADQTRFTVTGLRGESSEALITLPGRHTVLNALAAFAACDANGFSLAVTAPTLATFRGTGRRFELMGQAGGVDILSDYGHHPTAIRATLEAARQRYPNAKLWAVWQPHTFSRTRLLADSFARAFGQADHVLITDIYAARETAVPGDPTSADMARLATASGHLDARASGNLDATALILENEVRSGDVVILFSAGDAPVIGERFIRNRQMPSG